MGGMMPQARIKKEKQSAGAQRAGKRRARSAACGEEPCRDGGHVRIRDARWTGDESGVKGTGPARRRRGKAGCSHPPRGAEKENRPGMGRKRYRSCRSSQGKSFSMLSRAKSVSMAGYTSEMGCSNSGVGAAALPGAGLMGKGNHLGMCKVSRRPAGDCPRSPAGRRRC